ncbi:MAG: alpha/beta hydrolase [Bdellovibrionales bacterium]|nr:alpha/beta hydrolase [Bdellovibrionales bacterium]
MTAPLFCEKHPHLAKKDTLFIHGNLASTAWWRPTLTEWRHTGSMGDRQLIFADWRGCGKNADWPQDRPFTIEDLASDYLDLIEREHLEDVNLVGHSLGGLIALQMMIMAPKRFAKAVLLDPVGAGGVVLDEAMYEAFRQMAASRDLTRAVILSTVKNAETLDSAFSNELAEDAFKAVRGIGTSVLEILKTVDLREAATQVRTPTLILHGEHDQIIPMRDSEELASLMPAALLEKLSSAGHCWNVEDAKGFTKRLKEWFT